MADGAASDVLRGADRRLTPARADLAAADLEGMVSSARFVDARPMQVRAASTPLYPLPDEMQPMDSELLFGERFDVYDAQGGWVWGQAARDGYVGYAAASAFSEEATEPTHTVAVPCTSVYRSASIKTVPVETLSMTAMLSVEAVEGNFAKLATGGYVPISHIAALDERATDFVSVAETFLHAPYVWGGKTSAGLDCSALVQLSLARAGIACPRDSDMQAASLGSEVAQDAPPRRGDLMFWKGHVGIVADGDTFLHTTEFTMRTLKEPLSETRARIEGAVGIPLLCVRRPIPET